MVSRIASAGGTSRAGSEFPFAVNRTGLGGAHGLNTAGVTFRNQKRVPIQESPQSVVCFSEPEIGDKRLRVRRGVVQSMHGQGRPGITHRFPHRCGSNQSGLCRVQHGQGFFEYRKNYPCKYIQTPISLTSPQASGWRCGC